MEITLEKKYVREALAGSQGAFNALLNAYWSDVYALLGTRKLSEEDIEDLCIETFSKAFEKLGIYDPQYRFKTWLLRIAQNNYVDFIRRNAPLFSLFSRKMLSSHLEGDLPGESLQGGPVAYDTPESEMIRVQTLESVEQAMEYLRPAYRRALRLRYVEDLSVAEIAQRMSITPSNVKVLLMRGRRLLLKGLRNRG